MFVPAVQPTDLPIAKAGVFKIDFSYGGQSGSVEN
jgi:hypothetical protein